jgi:hypothetical protein
VFQTETSGGSLLGTLIAPSQYESLVVMTRDTGEGRQA